MTPKIWDSRYAVDDTLLAEHPIPARAAPGKRTLTQFLAPRDPRLALVRAAAPPRSGSSAERLPAIDPFDFSFADPAAPLHEAAQAGVAGGGAALPFQDQLADAFGPSYDLSGITAHVGGAAADACDQLGAAAYATGSQVAFRGAPDLHTAAHEAAHVLQQRAGIQLEGGVGRADDVYERHADAVADRVVAGQPADDLLAAFAGAGSPAPAVQRKADAATHQSSKANASGNAHGGGDANERGTIYRITILYADGKTGQLTKAYDKNDPYRKTDILGWGDEEYVRVSKMGEYPPGAFNQDLDAVGLATIYDKYIDVTLDLRTKPSAPSYSIDHITFKSRSKWNDIFIGGVKVWGAGGADEENVFFPWLGKKWNVTDRDRPEIDLSSAEWKDFFFAIGAITGENKYEPPKVSPGSEYEALPDAIEGLEEEKPPQGAGLDAEADKNTNPGIIGPVGKSDYPIFDWKYYEELEVISDNGFTWTKIGWYTVGDKKLKLRVYFASDTCIQYQVLETTTR